MAPYGHITITTEAEQQRDKTTMADAQHRKGLGMKSNENIHQSSDPWEVLSITLARDFNIPRPVGNRSVLLPALTTLEPVLVLVVVLDIVIEELDTELDDFLDVAKTILRRLTSLTTRLLAWPPRSSSPTVLRNCCRRSSTKKDELWRASMRG